MLVIAFQIIPGLEGTSLCGHSSVASGLREEKPEARPTTTLQAAGKKVAVLPKHQSSLTELDSLVFFAIRCFLYLTLFRAFLCIMGEKHSLIA